jgi:hypothetical protein
MVVDAARGRGRDVRTGDDGDTEGEAGDAKSHSSNSNREKSGVPHRGIFTRVTFHR